LAPAFLRLRLQKVTALFAAIPQNIPFHRWREKN
jgi:hypothetical protein